MWSSDSSDEEEEVVVRKPKLFRDRIDYGHMEMSYEYNERFRLDSLKFENLVSLLRPYLQRVTHRSRALSAELQLQITLHWLGTGAQYHAIADMHGICKASVCRAVHNTVAAVNNTIFAEYVKWPTNVEKVVKRFFSIKGMPMVCGCLDGTLINIDAPKNNEEVFVDRHGNHSISCLVVCGPDMTFYYSYANWPGSAHDSRVLRNSGLFRRMENNWRPIDNGVLLADSAYPLKDWLITPIVTDCNDEANVRFLRAHKGTRRVIENAIGILKEKFPCLNYLRLEPKLACEVFNCCVTLCNFARCPEEDAVNNFSDEGETNDGNDLDIFHHDEDVSEKGGKIRFQRLLTYFRN